MMGPSPGNPGVEGFAAQAKLALFESGGAPAFHISPAGDVILLGLRLLFLQHQEQYLTMQIRPALLSFHKIQIQFEI